MWLRSHTPLLALSCVLLFLFPSALSGNELSTLTPNELSRKLDRASNLHRTISNELSENWAAQSLLMSELSQELPALREDLSALKADSQASLAELYSLETRLASLEQQVTKSLTSLKNIEDDYRKLKNRTTWMIVGFSAVALGAIAAGIYFGIKGMSNPE